MRHRILVIDDAETLVEEVVTLLQFEGYDVLGVTSGADGVDESRAFRPDLVLSDILMPGLDGFDTLQRLKAQQETADVPVIFLTGRAEEEDGPSRQRDRAGRAPALREPSPDHRNMY